MYQKLLVSEKIAQNIIDLIRKAYYSPGDKLPNELILSEELGVSRASLREAFKILESQNIIEVRRGKGTFISEFPGLGNDPLGTLFFDLRASMPDVLNIMGSISKALLAQYPFLSDLQKAALLQAISEGVTSSAEEKASRDYLLTMLLSISQIAKLSESTYLQRIWRMHLQIIMTSLEHTTESATTLEGQCEAFKTALKHERMTEATNIVQNIFNVLK